jgi:predicted DNA-binding protein
MSKTITLPVRFPTELLDMVSDRAESLRRSKASIIVEAVEKHFHPNGLKPKTTATKKKAGAR